MRTLSSTDDTERLLAYLRTDDGHQFILELVADIGSPFANALQMSLERRGQSGLVHPDIAALATSDDVDWRAVAAQVDAALWQGFASRYPAVTMPRLSNSRTIAPAAATSSSSCSNATPAS
jgi:hypothetical protein